MLRTIFQLRLLPVRVPTAFKIGVTKLNQIRCYSNGKANDVQNWIDSLDEAQKQRVRFIQNEVKVKELENGQVPNLELLTVQNYRQILNLSQNQRLKYYNYLHKLHFSNGSLQMKRLIRQSITKENRELGITGAEKRDSQKSLDNKHLEYGLGKNCMIPKIYDRTINKWRNNRTFWHNMLDGPKLLFDCSYSRHMTPRENLETARQLSLCFGNNRRHCQPFEIHFCGLDQETILWHKFHKQIPTLSKRPLPLTLHEADIHEAFPKEQLVVLTPDSPNLLEEYNRNDIYVISGIVDRGDKNPVTIAKSKQFDLRTARLPMNEYRRCRMNNILTLDQVLNVMLEFKQSRDWNRAFQYVAARKFY